MKIQQDKIASIFLIVDVFGSLNMQVGACFPNKPTGVFSCSFRHSVGSISKNTLVHCENYCLTHSQIVFNQTF